MANYILAFHAGKAPKNPEDSATVMAKWGAWMNGLGKAMVNPGAPLIKSTTVKSTGTKAGAGANPQTGFTLVKADNMAAAIKLTKGCPALENGGKVVVSEMMDM